MAIKKNKKEIKVPFDKNGNMLNYAPTDGYYGVKSDVEWRDNKPFLATLVFKHITKGRSAVRGIFEEEGTGHQYTMFLTELQETIPLLEFGKITSKFRVVKRGANYGVVPIETSPMEQLALAAE